MGLWHYAKYRKINKMNDLSELVKSYKGGDQD